MQVGIDIVIMTLAVMVITIGGFIIVSKIKKYDDDASNKITFGCFISAASMVVVYTIMSMVLDYYLGMWW